MRHLLPAMMIGVCGVVSVEALAQQKTLDAVVIAPAAETAPPATVAAPAATPPGLPKCDETCVRANADKASAICARRIEAQAPFDFEWISRPFTGIFQQADPSSGEEPAATYRGDSIRFMSPQKDWVRVSYECVFDVEKATVTSVRVRPGRIDLPATLQTPSGVGKAANGGGQPSGPQPPVASAPLAAAILQAAKPQQKAATSPQPWPRIGEPSAIDISQVNPRRGSW